MKTSLVIPSTNNHFHYLDCILNHYKNGTVKPDEVIISISNSHTLDVSSVDNLKNKYYNTFESLELLLHNRTIPEGPNRGEGSSKARNNLIIYQDSDDVPHPQRVEIIKHFFENNNIVHLNHGYNFQTKFNNININDVAYKKSNDLFNLYFSNYSHLKQNQRTRHNRPRKVYDSLNNPLPYGSGFTDLFTITGGSLSILKSVLEDVSWEWEMDVSYDYDFCMDTLFYFNKSMIINSPLIWYNKVGNMEWACR